jgi:predicted DNA-binding transcriptional regulator AlpA
MPAPARPPAPADPPDVLDVQGLGAKLKCSERHLYRMVERKLVPEPVKLGALNRWPRAVIDKWISDGMKPLA